MEEKVTYSFGPYCLDTSTMLLCCKGRTTRLTPKVYRLLIYFLQHPGRLISHAELLNTVWDGRIVDHSALRQAINSLRVALGNKTDSSLHISTVPKCGYRFLSEVKVNSSNQTTKENNNTLQYCLQSKDTWGCLESTQEMKFLTEAFHHTSNGDRLLVFLSGKQGFGKTTLIDAFLANVKHPRLSILRARCVQMTGASEAFLPLLEAIVRRCREPNGRWLIERLNQSAPSWLYQIQNEISNEVIATFQLKLSHSNRSRMMREGAELFQTLSHNSHFILVLDNAQWSDESTLDLLNFLMFKCSVTQLLVIVSYRPCVDGPSVQRIKNIRTELLHRDLCRELILTGI